MDLAPAADEDEEDSSAGDCGLLQRVIVAGGKLIVTSGAPLSAMDDKEEGEES